MTVALRPDPASEASVRKGRQAAPAAIPPNSPLTPRPLSLTPKAAVPVAVPEATGRPGRAFQTGDAREVRGNTTMAIILLSSVALFEVSANPMLTRICTPPAGSPDG